MKTGTTRGSKRKGVSNELQNESDSDIELGVLPTLIGRQLRIAQLLAFKNFSMDVGGASLTPGSFEILELLEHNPGIGQTRLAAAIGLEKSSFVPAIVRLEDLGLVERMQSGSDKRANVLHITAQGHKVLVELRNYILARDKQITKGMSKADINTLNRLLKAIATINA